jgi:hypothetical protein
MPIKSFRGQIATGGQERILLHTRTGRTGYRIVKFQIMPVTMGGSSSELCVKIFKTEQTTVTAAVNWSDQSLLASGTVSNHTSGYIYPPSDQYIFESEIFNQDIYVTSKDNAGSEPCNYYVELEQIKLDSDEATVATLKNMRNTATQTAG